MSTVLLHGVEYSLCLEASSLQRGTCNVSSLCVLGDTEDGTLGIGDPVRCEETAEGCDENQAAVVLNGACELGDLV